MGTCHHKQQGSNSGGEGELHTEMSRPCGTPAPAASQPAGCGQPAGLNQRQLQTQQQQAAAGWLGVARCGRLWQAAAFQLPTRCRSWRAPHPPHLLPLGTRPAKAVRRRCRMGSNTRRTSCTCSGRQGGGQSHADAPGQPCHAWRRACKQNPQQALQHASVLLHGANNTKLAL